MSGQISKKRKFVADGVFKAELNDFLACELSEEGYSGCDVRVTHARTEVAYGSLEDCRHVSSFCRSSSVPPTPRRSSARRVAAFVNLPLSSRSVSSSPKTRSSSTPRRSNTVVSLLSLSARACATSSSAVLPSAGASHILPRKGLDTELSIGLATVFSVSSWSLVPRVARLSSLASSVLLVPSQ